MLERVCLQVPVGKRLIGKYVIGELDHLDLKATLGGYFPDDVENLRMRACRYAYADRLRLLRARLRQARGRDRENKGEQTPDPRKDGAAGRTYPFHS